MAEESTPEASLQVKWISKVYVQLCRYYPNDERPAKTKSVSVNGPMLLLALELGIRGWDTDKSKPILIKEIAAMREAGAFDKAWAFADYPIDDEETGTEAACLWYVAGPSANLMFISPSYEKLQEQRERDIKRNNIARSARKPKSRPKDLKTRGDIL